MVYTAKQEFLQYQPGDEVPKEETEFNDWVLKGLVEIAKPVTLTAEDKKAAAAEAKAVKAAEKAAKAEAAKAAKE